MTDTTATTTASQTPDPKAKKPRNWRRRILRLLGITLLLFLVFRIALVIALPTVINRVAKAYGVKVQYERLELSILGGDAGLWHVDVVPLTGGPSILTAEYLRGNIQPLKLFVGRLEVWRAEVDGVDLTMQRDEQGKIPLLDQVLAASQSAAPPAKTVTTSGGVTELDFSAPLKIDALRLNRVRIRIVDKFVQPNLDATLELTVRVSNLGSDLRPARFEIDVWSDPLLDALRVEGQGTSKGRELSADLAVEMRGLRLKPVAQYLEPLGYRPIATAIDARSTISIRTNPRPGDASAVTVKMDLSNIALLTDGVESVGLDSLKIVAPAIGPNALKVTDFLVDGARANGERTSSGNIAIAGIELLPLRTAPAIVSPVSTPAPAAVSPATLPSIDWSIDLLRVSNGKLTFTDKALAPTTQLSILLDEFAMRDFSPATTQPGGATLSAKLRAPGIADSISAIGRASPFAERKTLQVAFSADKIRPEALRPYLDALGLESVYESGSMRATLDAAATISPAGVITLDSSLSDIALRDTSDLFSFKSVSIKRARLNPFAGRVAVESIDLSGPSISAARSQAGVLTFLGLRTKRAKSSFVVVADAPTTGVSGRASIRPTSATAPIVTATASVPSTQPILSIDRLTWSGVQLNLQDDFPATPVMLSTSEAGLEIRNLRFGGEKAEQGTLHASFKAPGFAKSFDLNGKITPSSHGVIASFDVVGEQLNIAAIAPYLQAIGIEPQIRNGKVTASGEASLTSLSDVVNAKANFKNISFTDGPAELAGVSAFSVSSLALKGGELAVGDVVIDKPRIRASRRADGALVIAGLLFPATSQPTGKSTPSDPAVALQPPSSQPIPPAPAAEFFATLRSLQVNDAKLNWTDEAISPTVDTFVSASVNLNQLTVGKAADPGTFLVTLKAKDFLDELTIAGSINASPGNESAKIAIDGQGIRAGSLAAYIPAGIAVDLKDGRISSSVEASSKLVAAGGRSVSLKVGPSAWRDGDQSLASLDGFDLIANRIDPAAGIIDLKEISSRSVRAEIERSADGVLHAGGIAIGGSTPASSPVAIAATTQAANTSAPTTGPAADVNALIAAAKKPLPLVTLEKLDLAVESLKITDRSRPAESSPVEIANLRLASLAKIEVGGVGADQRPPVKLRLTGAAKPVIGAMQIDTEITPLAQQPTANIDVDLSQIDGDGILALVPEIKALIDGGSLKDGNFHTRIETTAKVARRGPVQVDFTKPIELDLLVKGTAYRAVTDGQVLIGLDEIRTEGAKIDPEKSLVHLKSLELTKPILHATRDADGIRALGLLVKLPTATTQPATAPTAAEIAPADPAPAVPVTASKTNPPAGEVRIDKLLVTGVDISYLDTAFSPKLEAPITNLDVEVRDITSRMLTENRTVRFNALVGSGKVDAPNKSKASTAPTTQKEFFSQVVASGKIGVYPKPSGYIKAAVNGLELGALGGPAKTAGVSLSGGAFDGNFDVRFKDDGAMDVRTKLVVTDLDLSEPPDGPIQKKIGTPLNVILVTLQDPDGSITIAPSPFGAKTDARGNLQLNGLGGAAAGAFLKVVTTAVLSAPLKAVSGVGDLLGFGGGKEAAPTVAIVEFLPGDVSLRPDAQRQLAAIFDRLKKDKNTSVIIRHSLGGGDLAIVGERSNPSLDDVRSIASQLRAEKFQLLDRRATLAGSTRGAVITQSFGETYTMVDQLRSLDAEIARVEDSLDKLYDLLKPGADLQASRRLRGGTLELVTQRLIAVRSAVIAASADITPDRIQVANARFEDPVNPAGGSIEVTVVAKKKSK